MRRPAAPRARTIACCVLAVAVTAGTGGCSLQTLGAPHGGTTLTATFDDVQSLVVGHSVQVSDVRIGTVTAIGLSGYRAKVTMSLQTGRRVPTGTTATIAKSSLLGENYVRLNLPAGRGLSTGPFLRSGAAIAQTSVQPDLEQISEKVGPLIAALGGQDLATISGESATALNGRGPELNTLIKRAAAVSDDYAAASADLGRALDSLGKLGDSLAKGKDDIGRLPGNVALATQRLQAERHRIKTSIQRLEQLARSVNAKVQQRHAKRLAVLLGRADSLLAAALRGREDLKTLATTVLTFLRGPSVSYRGQALLFLWIKGFLPGGSGASAGGAAKTGAKAGAKTAAAGPRTRSLTRLIGPRP